MGWFGKGDNVELPDGASTWTGEHGTGTRGTVRGRNLNPFGDDTYTVDVEGTFGASRIKDVPGSALKRDQGLFHPHTGGAKGGSGYRGPSGSALTPGEDLASWGVGLVLVGFVGFGVLWAIGVITWHWSRHGNEPWTSRQYGSAWAGAALVLAALGLRLCWSAARRWYRPWAVLWRAPLALGAFYLSFGAYFVGAPIFGHDPVGSYAAAHYRWWFISPATRYLPLSYRYGCDTLRYRVSVVTGNPSKSEVHTYSDSIEPVTADLYLFVSPLSGGNPVPGPHKVERAQAELLAQVAASSVAPGPRAFKWRRVTVSLYSGSTSDSTGGVTPTGGVTFVPPTVSPSRLPHRWTVTPETSPALRRVLLGVPFDLASGNEFRPC